MIGIIKTALEDNKISLDDPKSVENLSGFAELLIEAGKTMNLTAIKEPEEIAVKHVADSLSCAKFIPQGAKVLDIGSGAGFPAFPLAAARQDLSVFALDSTAKKMAFVESSASALGVKNLKTLVGRAEDLASGKDSAPKFREKFDVVTARAVARLSTLSELALPFVRIGGVFIAMKSRLADEELSEAQSAIKILGGKIESQENFTLVDQNETLDRTLIIIRKISHTPPQYPRPFSRIIKKPL